MPLTAPAGGAGGTPPIISPALHGLIAMNMDPAPLAAAAATGATTLRIATITLPVAATIGNLVVCVNAAGSGFTAGQVLGALYKADGTLIAKTEDATTKFGSTGTKALALTAEAGQSLSALPAGTYICALLANATSQPTFFKATSGGIGGNNVNTASPTLRGGLISAATAIPSPIGAVSGSTDTFWFGLS